MSYAPQTLLEARAYILAHTDLSPAEVGIVGDAKHTYGYHLGKDRLPANDYSRVTARDRAGLTNAASALDIGDFGDLWRLTEFLVHEARNGRLPDVREILGPLRDGRAYRWDHLDGWKAVRQAKGDSHEWHIHISYYRDSEHRDKTAPFRRYFEEDDMPSEREIWNHRIPPEASVDRSYPGIRDDGYRAGTWVQYGYRWARRAAERAAELIAGQAAILAKLDGGDDGAVRQAIREELAAHRELLVDELTDIVEQESDPAAVVAAVRELLSRVRVSVDPEDG